ncbi:hypothetical protein [Streptomyces sp. NPDC092370]|uniref:hypothetical protein n=1 Tax=Streptomyces sp. NPDC092370 TaxID=3366016 RepID=UPI0037FED08E
MGVQESVTVADPYGPTRSRAVTTPTAKSGSALTVGAAPTDVPVHAQHIALATDAVGSPPRAASGPRAAACCPRPGELPRRPRRGGLETYRALGILRDRDVHGVFRHRCTRTVGRVLPEPAQRDGGYRGYGAADAPVRPAARHAVRALTGG